jgi:hypothetical protein
MMSATILAIFFVPMFFVVVLRLFGRGGRVEPALRDEPEGRPVPPTESQGRPTPQGA